MRRVLVILSLVICVLLFLTGSGQAKGFIKGWSLRLSGEYGTAKIGDLNTFGQGRNDYLDAYVKELNLALGEEDRIKKEGEIKDLMAGIDIEGELMVDVFNNFAVAVGAGYIRRSIKSEARLLDGETEIYNESYNPAITALPVRLSVYYFYNILPSMRLFFKAGVGYYFAKSTLTFNLDSHGPGVNPFWETYDVDIKDQGFGYHGGFGYEFDLGSRLTFFIEASGRLCKLKNWQGDSSYNDVNGNVKKISGAMWSFEVYNAFTDEYYPQNYLSAEEPADPTIQNVRKFEADLSGIAFKLGIRIKF
jgi:hypothetical protein